MVLSVKVGTPSTVGCTKAVASRSGVTQSSLSRHQRKHSPDLARLDAERYLWSIDPHPWWVDIEWLRRVINAYYWYSPQEWLVVERIPYVGVTSPETLSMPFVDYGTLAVPLWMCGGRTERPKEHWAVWRGHAPCYHDGRERVSLLAKGERRPDGTVGRIAPRASVHVFSEQPDDDPEGLYDDHYDKVATYISRMTPEARKRHPQVSARQKRRPE